MVAPVVCTVEAPVNNVPILPEVVMFCVATLNISSAVKIADPVVLSTATPVFTVVGSGIASEPVNPKLYVTPRRTLFSRGTPGNVFEVYNVFVTPATAVSKVHCDDVLNICIRYAYTAFHDPVL